MHLALRTANAASSGAGCEGVAHIELREVPEEERDGPRLFQGRKVRWVVRVVIAVAPGRRAPFPCATRGEPPRGGRCVRRGGSRGGARACVDGAVGVNVVGPAVVDVDHVHRGWNWVS
eukprot:scaffold67774_cov42-Phaeocystis_antarctica.AAC.1